MKENALEMCLLFDFYGSILTPRQQEVFDLYYNDDLSLAEIAESMCITRQGVRDTVTRSVNILQDLEQRLGLVSRFRNSKQATARIAQLASELLDLNKTTFRSVEFDLKLAEICRLSGDLLADEPASSQPDLED